MALRELILKMSISVDGFVGGPNGEIDWLFPTLSDDAKSWLLETLGGASLHIMGSRTFKDMAAWWPSSTEIFAAPMNEIPKAVFSHKADTAGAHTTAALTDAARHAERSPEPPTLSETYRTWSDAEIVHGDLAAGIARLKQRPGKYILAHGGASFAQSLVAAGLIDEYRLLVHPVALGRGLALFSGLGKRFDLSLVDAKVFQSGAIAHVYRLAT